MSVRATLPLLSIVFAIGLVASVAAGRVYAQATTDVQLTAAAIVGNTLTITGKNFGSSAPTVSVGDAATALVRHSDGEIVVETPALAPGMYSLKVVRDAGAGGTAMGSLRIE